MKKMLSLLPLIIILVLTFTYQEEITNYVIKKVAYSQKITLNTSNEYSLNYDFKYIKKTNDFYAKDKKHLLDIIYTFLNNGDNEFSFYCDYENCSNELEDIINSKELITLVNFVHPFNEFRKIYLDINSFNKATLRIEKSYTNENIIAINKKLNEITNKIINDNMSDKEKIIAFHDYIIDTTSYDTTYMESNLTDIDNSSHKAIGPLFLGKGVCSGYADAMSIFLNRLNIPNYRISSNGHIWNFVKLDNKWYHIDLTWDDPVTDNGKDIKLDVFLLISTEQLEDLNTGYHIVDKNVYLEAN